MKLPITRLSLCTTAGAGNGDYDDSSARNTSPSATPASHTTASSLHSSLSLQTLPSVPSLQSLFLLENYAAAINLTPSLSSSLSLSSPITAMSLYGDLLYATAAHQINVYDSSTLAQIETFNSNGGSTGNVKAVAFCDGKVLTAHQDGKIRVWKLTAASNGRQRHKQILTLPTVTDRLLRFPLPKNHVRVRRHRKRLWVEHYDAVSGLAVGPNGNIYSVSWDKTLKVWAPKLGFRCLESVTAHDDAVNAVTVSVDGAVYTGSADGRIRVWAKPGSQKRYILVATLEKHKSAVNALALSVDGSILFSGACDRSILVWEREDSPKYMAVSGALRGHDGPILCLINVSYFLISGSADRTVRIWRRGHEGRFDCLSVLVGHLKPVKSIAARMEGEDGISVFGGGHNGDIKVWKVKFNSSTQ